jgi:hypothetical protein
VVLLEGLVRSDAELVRVWVGDVVLGEISVRGCVVVVDGDEENVVEVDVAEAWEDILTFL